MYMHVLSVVKKKHSVLCLAKDKTFINLTYRLAHVLCESVVMSYFNLQPIYHRQVSV